MSVRPDSPSRRDTAFNAGDAVLYLLAAVTYIGFSIYNKWLLDWIIGPLWCVAFVWGIPALWRWVRGEPVRPRRDSGPGGTGTP